MPVPVCNRYRAYDTLCSRPDALIVVDKGAMLALDTYMSGTRDHSVIRPLRLLQTITLYLISIAQCSLAKAPRIEQFTDLEIKYASIFRGYVVSNNFIPGPEGSPPGDYKFLIPLPERLAGVTYVGHAARLRLVLERARRGERIRVGTLGGSITAGQAVGGEQHSYAKKFVDWLNLALPPHAKRRSLTQIALTHAANEGRAMLDDSSGDGSAAITAASTVDTDLGFGGGVRYGSGMGDGDGGSRGDGAVNGARQRRARRATQELKGHAFINGAVPGIESAYAASCLHHHLIPEPDLVLVDFAMNDLPTGTWYQKGPSRREFERLLRKVLSLPSRPAVVLVNMYATGPSHGLYWYTAERDFAEFATYYGLPSVSLKAAVLPSAAVGGAEQVSLGSVFNGGLNHPGHGGHVIVAELLITLALDLLHANPRFSGVGSAGGDAAAQEAPSDAAMALLVALAARPLPPPLGPDNYESSSKTCYTDEEMQALVQPPVEGWEWTDEGRGKWGYVAREPGKTIRIKVDTQLGGNRSEEHKGAPIVLQLAYLQSYRGMATAQVKCESGCKCKPVVIDAYDARRVSLTWMKDIKVSQHPDCVLLLTSGRPSGAALRAAAGNATDSSGAAADDDEGEVATSDDGPATYKFKLMGVVVGEEPGASQGAVLYLRTDSHDLWKRPQHGHGHGHGRLRQRRRWHRRT